jgi:hypothetical protein
MAHERVEDVAVRGELDAQGLQSLAYDTRPRLAGGTDEVRHGIYGHVVGQLPALCDSTTL